VGDFLYSPFDRGDSLNLFHTWLPIIIPGVYVCINLYCNSLINFLAGEKDFQFKAYGIRERDVMSQSGWLFQKLEVIPISKIQYCVVKKGPLEQKFKLASLRLFTAGQQSDITLSGLKAEEAERLKKWIISKQGEDA